MMRRREFVLGAAAVSASLGVVPSASGATGLTVEMVHRDPLNPVLGNPDGDVTMVEFFDYQCPWCKKGHPEVMKSVQEDGGVRLLMRDWPIFGEPSVRASRLVLAAERERYALTLETLFESTGKLDDADVDRLLAAAGNDVNALEAAYRANSSDIDGLLQRNMDIALAFGFSGTPSFVIGTQVFFGYLDEPAIKRAIAMARNS